MRPMSIIIAVDSDGGFGKDGKIPWNFPEDLKHFQKITKDGICIMGRNTYEDMYNMVIQRRKKKSKKKSKKTPTEITEILPGRRSFVVSNKQDWLPQGASKVGSIREAINNLDRNEKREIFIIGGRRIFMEALTWATTIYMTIVRGDPYDCDIYFPLKALNKYNIVDGKQTDNLYFVTYKRVR